MQAQEEILKKSNRVKFRASLEYEAPDDKLIKRMKFKIASYTVDGEFLGWSDLRD